MLEVSEVLIHTCGKGGGGCRVVDFGGCGLLSGCWVGVGWLLDGYWVVVGWLLGGCWVVVGWLLGGCWVVVRWLLSGCWVVGCCWMFELGS